MGVYLVSCWLVLFYGCYAGPFLIVDGEVGVDGSQFINRTRGSANTDFTDVERFQTLIMMKFSGASTGNGVVRTGFVMTSNGGRCDVLQ